MKQVLIALVLVAMVIPVFPVAAQDDMMTPTVEVDNQAIYNDYVVVDYIWAEVTGWMVIHAEGEDGGFGPVIGHRHVHPGQNNNVRVHVDPAGVTDRLYAMLHVDTGEMGAYEFGTVDGADGPVMVDGSVLAPSFNVEMISAKPQFVDDGTFVVDHVVSDEAGFIVIHADDQGAPGPVIGHAYYEAGNTANLEIAVETDAMLGFVWPMMHYDSGELGVYEFGDGSGNDGPFTVNDEVVVFQVPTQDEILAHPQVIINGDNWPGDGMGHGMMDDDMMDDMGDDSMDDMGDDSMDDMGDDSMDDMGDDSMDDMGDDSMDDMGDDSMDDMGDDSMDDMGDDSMDDMGDDSMDDMGDDSMDDMGDDSMDDMGDDMGSDMMMMDGYTFYADVLAREAGWLVVHADADGGPGPVIGFTQIDAGFTSHVGVALDEMGVTNTLWPMLHVDTGEAGVYEFGTVDGADGPVRVGERVVVRPVSVAPGFGAHPQSGDGEIHLDYVSTDAISWVVIHASVDGAPGPVLGFLQVNGGFTPNVAVAIEDPSTVEGAALDQVFPMLHYDTGELGVYEFGTVDGEDVPIMLDGRVVVGPLEIGTMDDMD